MIENPKEQPMNDAANAAVIRLIQVAIEVCRQGLVDLERVYPGTKTWAAQLVQNGGGLRMEIHFEPTLMVRGTAELPGGADHTLFEHVLGNDYLDGKQTLVQ